MSLRAWRCFLLLAPALLLAGPGHTQSLQPVPKLEARVTDLTGTLTADQQTALEAKLKDFEGRKGSQLAVLMVPTTEPEALEQYSIRVVEQWKLGRQKVDDGALLIVAKNDRALRIEVGYGLEGALTDVISHRIIDETISPLFRQGDYYGGINAGLDKMIQVVDGEPLAPPDPGWRGQPRGLIGLLPVLFIGVLIGSTLLRSLFGRGLGSALTGAGTGVLVWFAGQAFLLAALAGLAAFLFAVVGGFGAGRGWSSYPRAGVARFGFAHRCFDGFEHL